MTENISREQRQRLTFSEDQAREPCGQAFGDKDCLRTLALEYIRRCGESGATEEDESMEDSPASPESLFCGPQERR